MALNDWNVTEHLAKEMISDSDQFKSLRCGNTTDFLSLIYFSTEFEEFHDKIYE